LSIILILRAKLQNKMQIKQITLKKNINNLHNQRKQSLFLIQFP